ncbi:MAG: glycosyltransferase family 87 protein, partial [Chloroflexota bacterium]
MKTTPLKSRSATLWISLILGFIFLLTVTRLVIIGIRAGKESLQGDFVAYYTAGQALNLGLSPYKNFIAHDPPLWDGVARSRYSRFLYPPLVAALFQPLAWMSYATSKYVWELITLASLGFSLYLTTRIFLLKSVNQYLAAGVVATLFFPVLTHIEIGQIDAITLLLITVSIVLITRNLKREGLLAGFCLAVATLLKLHTIYFLPFILIKKRVHVLQGFLYGIIIIILTTMIFPGRDYLYDYAINQFPRISGIMAVDDSLGRAERQLIKNML